MPWPCLATSRSHNNANRTRNVTMTYLPAVMWKLPATLLTVRLPRKRQPFFTSGVAPSLCTVHMPVMYCTTVVHSTLKRHTRLQYITVVLCGDLTHWHCMPNFSGLHISLLFEPCYKLWLTLTYCKNMWSNYRNSTFHNIDNIPAQSHYHITPLTRAWLKHSHWKKH